MVVVLRDCCENGIVRSVVSVRPLLLITSDGA